MDFGHYWYMSVCDAVRADLSPLAALFPEQRERRRGEDRGAEGAEGVEFLGSGTCSPPQPTKGSGGAS